jgi:hypothetical protein
VNRSDVIFGVARENAPARRMVGEDEPVLVVLPGNKSERMTFAEASMLHYELGQTLARMMRTRGSATPPDGDIGGTPAALKEAA